MGTVQWQSSIIPAQLSFLAIYNPSLGGESDESFRDELVFYFSRAAHELRIAARRHARNDAAGGDALRAEENEKLRQIGLAQGMVDFAKTFSNGKPVDSIETEKSRIVLHELEEGWWILASIDLTRLPAIVRDPVKATRGAREESKTAPSIEYSSREVSPPALLIQQLLQAHAIFSLHHGPSLNDLFVRLPRDKFCNALDRFWTRFARNWDVLLHGNPAADVFGGVKLASGGELGFGVGEEEWGSGEREVLEDLARRTDGLVDLIAARFGEPASAESEDSRASPSESLPWMGSGVQPTAADGIIFGGIGTVQRHSLRDISLWMRHIYTHGEQAYGVKDNPLRERRRQKRRNASNPMHSGNNGSSGKTADVEQRPGSKNKMRSTSEQSVVSAGVEASTGGTQAPSDNTTHIHIPPPIVSAAEESLERATREADRDENLRDQSTDESGYTLGIPDNYMKYLTFGLSTLGKQKPTPTNASETKSVPEKPPPKVTTNKNSRQFRSAAVAGEPDELNALTNLEPIPDGQALEAKITLQKRQENRGHFVIGLKGDLAELDDLSENDQTDLSDGSLGEDTNGSRIVLRTIQVDTGPDTSRHDEYDNTESPQLRPTGSEHSADASRHYRRVRVLIYVHRPFMYCFLFNDRTSSLQWTKFYKSLHRNLVPIHKPLLLSTDPAKIAQRIASSQATLSDTQSVKSMETSRSGAKASKYASIVYDLIYDPKRLTLHSSLPNIPEPGTPAAEGILSSSKNATEAASWTRVEALSVHSQILNTLGSVAKSPGELERTSKTSRGWWVVWMKVSTSPGNDYTQQNTKTPDAVTSSLHAVRSEAATPTNASEANEIEDRHRIAFLVRRAHDAPAVSSPTSSSSRAMSSMLEVMSLGMAGREDDTTGGASAGWGPAALAGGIGLDARKYVEGLLSLNR